MTSREFNQDSGRAKSAAADGPVVITDRGRPAYVLLTYSDYEKLVGGTVTMIDLLALPEGVEDVELELPDRKTDYGRAMDFD
nr:type II toxin-antitoxin system Phd/YefM family antitoxin [Nocardia panacis]